MIKAVDQAIIALAGPFIEEVVRGVVLGHPVRFDHLRFVEMLGVGEDAGRRHKPRAEGAPEIDNVEDVIFHILASAGYGLHQFFGTPPMHIESAVQDGAGIENFA